MQAHRGKLDPGKQRCDRCQQSPRGVRECSFTFRHPFAYWKALYTDRQEKRLTLRRQRQWADETGFDWRKPPAYYMDLCEACWEQCRQPFDGFPLQFYREVVLEEPAKTRSLEKRVRI